MTSNNVKQERYSYEEWLERYTPEMTINCAKTSITVFDQFCQSQNGLNGKSKDVMIEKYQNWINQDKPDIQSICTSLDKFIRFMAKSHDDIVISVSRTGKETTFKGKKPKTIRLYFGFVKSYLRICHGVRLTIDDIKDYVKFPKTIKEARKPVLLSTLKLLFGRCDRERRALYYVLLSSGMRLGEGLSLFKIDVPKYREEIDQLWDSDRRAAKRKIREYTRTQEAI